MLADRRVSRVNYAVPRLSKLQEVAWRCFKDACNLDKLEHTYFVLTTNYRSVRAEFWGTWKILSLKAKFKVTEREKKTK